MGSGALATSKRATWPRLLAFAIAVIAGFFISMWLDQPVYRLMVDRSIEAGALKMFRTAGYFPLWVFVAVVLLLVDAKRLAGRPLREITTRAELVFWPTLLSGILAAVLQVVFRRERPSLNDGAYAFRPFSERTFDGGGLGLPSGDVSVAFAAAFILIRMYPAATPAWLVMGACSVLSRVLGGDHFLSDAYAAAVLGFLCAWFVWRIYLAGQPQEPEDQRGATGAGSSRGLNR